MNFPTNFCCVSFCSFLKPSSLFQTAHFGCKYEIGVISFSFYEENSLIRLRRWIPTNIFPNLSPEADILVKGPPLARILVQFETIKISFMYILTMSQDGTSPIWSITLKLTFMSSNWNHLHCLGIKSQLFEVKSSYIQRPKTDW